MLDLYSYMALNGYSYPEGPEAVPQPTAKERSRLPTVTDVLKAASPFFKTADEAKSNNTANESDGHVVDTAGEVLSSASKRSSLGSEPNYISDSDLDAYDSSEEDPAHLAESAAQKDMKIARAVDRPAQEGSFAKKADANKKLERNMTQTTEERDEYGWTPRMRKLNETLNKGREKGGRGKRQRESSLTDSDLEDNSPQFAAQRMLTPGSKTPSFASSQSSSSSRRQQATPPRLSAQSSDPASAPSTQPAKDTVGLKVRKALEGFNAELVKESQELSSINPNTGLPNAANFADEDADSDIDIDTVSVSNRLTMTMHACSSQNAQYISPVRVPGHPHYTVLRAIASTFTASALPNRPKSGQRRLATRTASRGRCSGWKCGPRSRNRPKLSSGLIPGTKKSTSSWTTCVSTSMITAGMSLLTWPVVVTWTL